MSAPSIKCDACGGVFAAEKRDEGGWQLMDARQFAERKEDGSIWLSNLFHVACSPETPKTWRMTMEEPKP
jgi:hypothetical protein